MTGSSTDRQLKRYGYSPSGIIYSLKGTPRIILKCFALGGFKVLIPLIEKYYAPETCSLPFELKDKFHARPKNRTSNANSMIEDFLQNLCGEPGFNGSFIEGTINIDICNLNSYFEEIYNSDSDLSDEDPSFEKTNTKL